MANDQRIKNGHRDFEQTVLYLRELRRKGFYGRLVMDFQAGNICDVDLTQKVKPWEPMPDVRPIREVAG